MPPKSSFSNDNIQIIYKKNLTNVSNGYNPSFWNNYVIEPKEKTLSVIKPERDDELFK